MKRKTTLYETVQMTETEINQVLQSYKKKGMTYYSFDPSRGLFCKENGDETLISNSMYIPLNVYKNQYIHRGKTETSVELAIIVASKQNEALKGFQVEIPLDEIEKYDFQKDVDTSICTAYGNHGVKIKIANMIRQQVADIHCQERFWVEQLGWVNIQGRNLYCAGNMILGNTEGLNIVCSKELKGYIFETEGGNNFEIDKECIQNYLNLYIRLYKGKSPIVLSYFVLSFLKDILKEALIPIKFSMFLTGENQSYKTTIASYGTALYSRITDVEANIHNLSGTEAQLHRILHIEKDMVSLIDDLNLSDSKAIMREQERKMSSIIFAAANNVGRETMKYQNSINSLVMLCGEYCLSNTSTNNRLVVLKLEKDAVSKTDLTEFEKKRGYLGTFAYYFIKWCADEREEIGKYLKESFLTFRKQRDKEESFQERLQEHYKMLSMSYEIFLCFCKNKGIIIDLTEDDFNVFLSNAMNDQIELLELEGREEDDYVMQSYNSLDFYWEDYVKSVNKANCWQKGICYDDTKKIIYIPGDMLTTLVWGEKDKLVSAYEIASQFQKMGLLLVDQNKNHSRTKKFKGKRAYCIDYHKWEEYVKENYTYLNKQNQNYDNIY